MKSILRFGFLTLVLSSCVSSEHTMVGTDSDIHSCKGSAGYTWSVLRKECIQPFENGTAFNSADKTQNAYVILNESASQAEVFVPIEISEAESILFRGDKTLFSNKAGSIAITIEKDLFILNCKGQKFSTPRTIDLDSLFLQ